MPLFFLLFNFSFSSTSTSIYNPLGYYKTYKGINTYSPMDFVWGFPTEQTFLDESESQDYKLKAGDLNSLDFRDPTQHSHYTPPSLEREQGWHKDSLSLRPRVESTIASMLFLDIGTVLEGQL